VPLRRYIANRLGDYYAQPPNHVVGSFSKDINYKSLFGEWHWKRLCKDLYERDQLGQWLTPVELFRPYYSQVFAEYVAQQLSKEKSKKGYKFDIVEMGGGRGTNAEAILTQLQSNFPDIYEQLRNYTIVDSSPSLHELQKRVLLDGGHGTKLKFSLKDLTDVAESNTELFPSSETTPTFVLGFELLDNLGHDKVRRDPVTHKLEHALVDDKGAEIFKPLSGDTLLKNILIKVPSYGGRMGNPIWVPSVACGVLIEIKRKRPRSWIVLADFDYLPPPDLDNDYGRLSVYGDGEPLVTSMEGIDYECYLKSPHLADILYPTDFERLSYFCSKCFAYSVVKITKQGQFLSKVGPAQVKATTSMLTGYSPMISDFLNCSVLTVSPQEVLKA